MMIRGAIMISIVSDTSETIEPKTGTEPDIVTFAVLRVTASVPEDISPERVIYPV